ncbi:MAG: DUF4880 domain-containing protein [Pseudomonadota bacterium]
MTNEDRADAEARAWVARLKSGEATADDAEAFEAWRSLSPDHDRAVRRAVRLWSLAGAVGETVAAAPARPRPTRRAAILAGGSVLASASAWQAAALLGYAPTFRSLSADRSTGVGIIAPIALPGVVGSLDGASALEVEGPRAVRLIEGALFVRNGNDVVQEASITLTAPSLLATLSNGAAECRIGDRGVELACAAGTVEISAPGPIALVPGETATILDGGELVRGERAVSEIGGWTNGILTFRNRRLGDVVADLNRHRPGRVLLTRSLLAERRVSGTFHLARPDEIVTSLVDALGLERRDLPARIVLLS